MALPALPSAGANWSAWGAAVHDALNNPTLTPDATTTAKGIVELATTTEATTGTATDLAVTPVGLKAVADTKVALTGDQTIAGAKTFSGAVTVGPGGADAPSVEQYPSQGAPKTMLIRDHLAVRRRLGVGGAEPSQRLPINFSTTMDGSALTNAQPADKVIFQNTVTIKGDFTNEATWGMPSASFVFGGNDFVVTGSAAGDAAGIANIYGRLSEVHIYAPGRTMSQVIAFQAEAHIEASATSTNVTTLIGVQVKAPRNAGGGTLTNATGIRIESPTVGTTQRAIHVVGTAESYFEGPVRTNNQVIESGTAIIRGQSIVAGVPGTAGQGRLTVVSNADASIVQVLEGTSAQTGDLLRVHRGPGNIKTRFDAQGRVGMRATAAPVDADVATGEWVFYVDTTAGAPKLMAKCKDSAGTVFTRTFTAT